MMEYFLYILQGKQPIKINHKKKQIKTISEEVKWYISVLILEKPNFHENIYA